MCVSKNQTIFKEEESIEILKILDLINNSEECQMNINELLKMSEEKKGNEFEL